MIRFKEQLFEKLVKATQEELLHEILISELASRGMDNYIHTNDYLYVKGDIPVLLVAHLDTVHRETVKTIVKKNGTWSSPQGIGGDDRCGVYMILELLENLPKKPYVLFSTDEEIGCIGTGKFLKQHSTNKHGIKFMIEFDRKGRDECIFYECNNKSFQEFIMENTNYNFNTGSFTDICEIMEVWDIAGVNLSCGYYNAHTLSEYVVINEMMNTIRVVYSFLEKLDTDKIEMFGAELYQYSYNNRGWYDYDYDLPSTMDMSRLEIEEILEDYYYMTVDGCDYYLCECGEVVDKENFIHNEFMCCICYDRYFEDEEYTIFLHNDENKSNMY